MIAGQTPDPGIGFPVSRIPYSKRKESAVWPGGATLAVLVYTAPEQWQWNEAEVFPTAGSFLPRGERLPSLSTRSGVAYGFNIGLPRLSELFASYSMSVTMWTTGNSIEQFPDIIRQVVDEGHELGAHGYTEGSPMSTLSAAGQRESIVRTTELIRDLTGENPRGWLSPGAAATRDTMEVISELGYEYHGDLQDDELPYFVDVRGRRLVEIPYRKVGNLNDFPLLTRSITSVDAGFDHLRQAFDAYLDRSRQTPLLFNYGTHPFVSGRPDNYAVLDRFLRYVHGQDGVWVASYGEIASWWRSRFGADSDAELLSSE